MPRAPVVTAIVAAYNEADVIGQVVGDLLQQGLHVYFLDHGSTDGTLAEVERLRGEGRVDIERFVGPASPEPGRVSWAALLRRKEELAASLDSDWFVHHDADEFRESPWLHLGLRAAIEEVDGFGYDAIDFELLNFWPTRQDGWGAAGDVRSALRHFERARPWDKLQVRCWKKTAHPVDLATSGGHEAVFPGRRVFPLRFLLRHYPFRSPEQARRKLTEERATRFLQAERARGWHRQYDGLDPDALLRDAASLAEFDPARERLQLVLGHRLVEDLQQVPAARERALVEAQRREEELSRSLDAQNREVLRLQDDHHAAHRELDRLNRAALAEREATEAAHRELDARNHELLAARAQGTELAARIASLEEQLAAAHGEAAALARDLERIRTSRVWRWSAPLRGASDRLRSAGD